MALMDELTNAADRGSDPFSPTLTKTPWHAKKNAAIRQRSITSIGNPLFVTQGTWKPVFCCNDELLKAKAFSPQFPDEIVPYHIIPFRALAFGIHLEGSLFRDGFCLSKPRSD